MARRVRRDPRSTDKKLELIYAKLRQIDALTEQILIEDSSTAAPKLGSALLKVLAHPTVADYEQRYGTIVDLLCQLDGVEGLVMLVPFLDAGEKEAAGYVFTALTNHMSVEACEQLLPALEALSLSAKPPGLRRILLLLDLVPDEALPAIAIARRIYLRLLHHADKAVVACAMLRVAAYEDADALGELESLNQDERVVTIQRQHETKSSEVTIGKLAREVMEEVSQRLLRVPPATSARPD